MSTIVLENRVKANGLKKSHFKGNTYRQVAMNKEDLFLFKGTKQSLVKRVLLVESDIQLQEQHQDTLVNLGFNVTLAIDYRVASNLLTQHPYDLIVIHDALPAINALLLMRVTQIYAKRNK